MNVIVTGSESQIAKNLNKNIKKIDNKKYFFFSKKELNIFNFEKTLKIVDKINPDIIINCAAYTDVKNAELKKNKANQVNNLSLKKLSNISNLYNSLLIHFSTDYEQFN